MAKYPNRASRDGFSALARIQRNVARMARGASMPLRTQTNQTTDKVEDAHDLAVTASDDAAEALEYATAALEEVEGLATVASTGDYEDLTNRPTALSDFTNDMVFLPIGCVLMMSSNTSPGLMGAQGTWAFRRAVNFPLTGDTTYYLYERTG